MWAAVSQGASRRARDPRSEALVSAWRPRWHRQGISGRRQSSSTRV